jgi:hypothetical protein
MAHYCWKCGREQHFDVKVGVKVGRRDECLHCGEYLHCCRNCALYDPDLHNQCREPHAPFIREREEPNFCTHFDFRDSESPPAQEDTAAAKAKLEALFKNLK